MGSTPSTMRAYAEHKRSRKAPYMPKQTAKWYSIRKLTAIAAAAGGVAAAAEIFIYGDIGESYWEETVTARDFVKEIAALDADQITVRINTIGGSVPDGLAIY